MKRTSIALSVFAFGLTQAAFAGTVQLIQNGTFESGTTASWTPSYLSFPDTTGACNSTFAAQSTASGCASGVNPASGSYAAYASSSFPNSLTGTGEFINYLSQDFTLPSTFSSLQLTWDDTATWSGIGTFEGAGVLLAIYQNGGFIGNHYSLTNPATPGSNEWTSRSWDLTSLLQSYAGQTLTLRLTTLAFLENRGSSSTSIGTSLIAGFDNVSLTATTADTTVPEPATFAVGGLGVVALAAFRKVRLAKQRR